MRRVLLATLAAWVVSAGPAWAALSVIQGPGTHDTDGNNTVAVTLSSTASGSLLIALWGCDTGGAANCQLTTVSGVAAGGNAFTQATASRGIQTGLRASDVWYLQNAPSGLTTVTATLSGTVGGTQLWVMEVSGALTAGAFDIGQHTDNLASCTACACTAFTTAQNDEIVVGEFENAGSFSSAGTNYTALAAQNGNGAVYRITTASGSHAAAENQTPSSSGSCAAAAFKAAAAASSPRLTLMGVGAVALLLPMVRGRRRWRT